MFKHVLVATDGSRLADKAVKAAIALAGELGAKVTAFYATTVYPITPFPEYPAAAEILTPEMWKAEQDKYARRVLGKVETKARRAGVACVTMSSVALHPYEAILEAAKKARCDLIVMASHGRRGIRRAMLGSETTSVMTHGTLPVLVVR